MKNPKTRKLLKDYFGHDALRPGQEEVIERVLNGVNTLAVLPTGGGKSLCYQLPAMMLDGLCVVISPLIALMKDQLTALAEKGIDARGMDSSMSDQDNEETLELIRAGRLKMLYLSPERLAEPGLYRLLKTCPVSMVAIDEAHCISEWGHSFRPAYISLPRLVKGMKPGVVLALTATAAPDTARSIRKLFGILKRDQVQASFYRENLEHRVVACPGRDKDRELIQFFQQQGRLPAVVYCLRRADTEAVSAQLQSSGVASRAYHAGLPSDVRTTIQDGFLEQEFQVICATIAFGMGVDMSGIRSVVHYHPPKSPEGWMQETGRAGRDGDPATCLMLVNQNDRVALESLIEAKMPSERAIQAVLQNVFSQGKIGIVSKYNLTTQNDVPWELLDVLLARLEKDRWIRAEGGSWMWCRVSPLRWDRGSRDRILQGFGKAERVHLIELLDAGRRVNLLELSGGNVTRMNRITRLLRELESSGDVRLSMSHSLVHYRVLKEPESLSELTAEVAALIEEHKKSDLARVDSVFKIATSRKCVAASLVGYFGEKMQTKCGRCSSCVGSSKRTVLPYDEPSELSMEEMALIQQVVAEKHPALSTPARLARFLCGVYSPAMGRYRLYQHAQWGMLVRLSYSEVVSATHAVMGEL